MPGQLIRGIARTGAGTALCGGEAASSDRSSLKATQTDYRKSVNLPSKGDEDALLFGSIEKKSLCGSIESGSIEKRKIEKRMSKRRKRMSLGRQGRRARGSR